MLFSDALMASYAMHVCVYVRATRMQDHKL